MATELDVNLKHNSESNFLYCPESALLMNCVEMNTTLIINR